jgi:YbbR domain-containing protein
LFRWRDYHVYVDVTGYGPGEVRVPVQFDGFPSYVQVEAEPDEVRVVLEPLTEKTMPVAVEWLGTLPEGYRVGTPSVRPTEVTVGGAESLLERVVAIKAYVHLDAVSSKVQAESALRAVDAQGNRVDVTIKPKTVRVEAAIQIPKKTVPLRLQWRGSLPDGLTLSDVAYTPQEVTLYGPTDVLARYDEYQGPMVDLSGAKKEQVFQLSLPIEKGLIRVEPAEITVRLTVSPTVTKTLENVPIQVSGLADGYELVWLQPEDGLLDVVLTGKAEQLDRLSRDDVRLRLDVSRQTVGEHTGNVAADVPASVQLQGELPAVRFLLRPVSEVPAGAPEDGPSDGEPQDDAADGSSDEPESRP